MQHDAANYSCSFHSLRICQLQCFWKQTTNPNQQLMGPESGVTTSLNIIRNQPITSVLLIPLQHKSSWTLKLPLQIGYCPKIIVRFVVEYQGKPNPVVVFPCFETAVYSRRVGSIGQIGQGGQAGQAPIFPLVARSNPFNQTRMS